MSRLLADLRAVERMLAEGFFETGVRRIGAEQELVLVDDHWDPAPVAVEVLQRIDDPHVTTELARFNLEFNCDPLHFEGKCLSRLEAQLHDLLELVRKACREEGARPLLMGILPTLQLSDLAWNNITPRERYYALNDRLTKLRGGGYELDIKGIDELTVRHETVMLEALNTSFQLHYQVDPETFALSYNVAQAVAGPMIAAAANSPVLFGKRLWHETRIAIFQQAVETRRPDMPHERDTLPRVRFGEQWCESSVMELFRSDVARQRMLFGSEVVEDPFAALDAGRAPKLAAIQTHNSTVYRWNRACYGITEGRPHLRIENRLLGAGPTILDEMANAALWFGLMAGLPSVVPELTDRLDFDDAKGNFVAAAKQGLTAQFTWLDGKVIPARSLLLDELIPIARAGLVDSGVDSEDVEKYLSVMHDRVDRGQTGAQWMLSSVARMRGKGTRAERLCALTAATGGRQDKGHPVHEWELADVCECGDWRPNYLRVGQYMTTNLFTVHEDESLELVASIMDWQQIRHVPVEDSAQRLVGLVSYRRLLRVLADSSHGPLRDMAVRDVMLRDPITGTPSMSTLEAVELMRANGLSCLPIVSDGKLVGIVTEHDFMQIAGQLLEQSLRASEAEASKRAQAGQE
ncbi:MAG: CBS domain-containing protein [Planctomycetota bacterium]|nr:MAG: CBS domain-containing protein [Planctomycetota bacterium]